MLTDKMQEIVDWWVEYGIEHWETDDNRILFDELLRKIYELPTCELEYDLINYFIESGRLSEYIKFLEFLKTPFSGRRGS